MEELKIIELFCLIDDITKRFNEMCSQQAIEYKKKKIRKRESRMSLAEVMTILLMFHQSNYRTFKHFYLKHVKLILKPLFPKLVGYPRVVRMISEVIFPMFCFVQEHRGVSEGIRFLDSTVLTSCHVKRASSVFKGMAKWGKTTVGWFFGFKLHVVINHHAEIVAFRLTSGKVNDRVPVPDLLQGKKGKVYADKGYIGKRLFKILMDNGILLFTKLQKKMKNKLMPLWDKIMLRKRALIESVINLLKTNCQIEHHRHRSKWNFLSHLLSGLGAYCLRPDKPQTLFHEARVRANSTPVHLTVS
jgi:Transposase DDE domain